MSRISSDNVTDVVDDNNELARFREQWKAELNQRALASAANSASTTQDVVVRIPPAPAAATAPTSHVPVLSSATSLPVVTPAYTRAHYSGHTSKHTSKHLTSAIETYRSAVQSEQTGNMDEALRLYRQAFRLDTNVDKAYHTEELRLSALASLETSRERKRASTDLHVADLTKSVKRLSLPSSKTMVTGNLAEIISSFPSTLEFEPEDEKLGVPLRVLPDELLVLILKTLDTTSLERFAAVDKKARVLSLDSSIWR